MVVEDLKGVPDAGTGKKDFVDIASK